MMMICAWGFIEIYSNSNDTKILGAREKGNTKRPTCGSVQFRLRQVRRKIAYGGIHEERYSIIMQLRLTLHVVVQLSPSVLLSPSMVFDHLLSEHELYIPLHHSRFAEICQGNGCFVYNSFTNSDYKSLLATTKKGEHQFAGRRGANSQAAIRKDVLDKNIAYFGANVNRKIPNGRQEREQFSISR